MEEDLLQRVNAEDLLSYGFIPELVGRLPVSVGLRSLDKDGLISVLTEPRNALVKQYQALFKMDDVELVFMDDALSVAANDALEQGTGARALRSILEQTLLDVMYELPSLSNVTKCVVGPDAIRGAGGVELITASEESAPFASQERKSA